MPKFVASTIAFGLLAVLSSAAAAQSGTATARIGAGQTVQAKAAPKGSEGVLLEFLLPDGRTQNFEQLGEALVAIDGKAGPGLLARDLNGDGVDEVILRGSVPPDRGAMLVFRWERTAGEFVPVTFTDDRDRTNPFAVVDAKEPVVLHANGNIEVQFVTTRQDGRKSSHVARYRWNGNGFTQSSDN
jgi:hypothetical protein